MRRTSGRGSCCNPACVRATSAPLHREPPDTAPHVPAQLPRARDFPRQPSWSATRSLPAGRARRSCQGRGHAASARLARS